MIESGLRVVIVASEVVARRCRGCGRGRRRLRLRLGRRWRWRLLEHAGKIVNRLYFGHYVGKLIDRRRIDCLLQLLLLDEHAAHRVHVIAFCVQLVDVLLLLLLLLLQLMLMMWMNHMLLLLLRIEAFFG